MTPVLMDTGCIVALLDSSERNHQQAVAIVSSIDAPLITCEAVIAESCYLLRGIKGAAQAVVENVHRNIFLVPFQLTGSAQRIAKLLKKYSDIPMDVADACLVELATEYQSGQILTLDSDFEIYRWGKNRPFELLLKA
jgi:predicted nucleic acid-binding protein